MSDTRTLRLSFNGGVLSPQFFGQVEDGKSQTGLARCLNATILPQGPVANRAGSKYVNAGGDMTNEIRVIPFAFSVAQTYAMELGEYYIRFHTMGATLGPSSVAAWNGGTPYLIGDTVEHSGVYYYCVADSTGDTPPNAAFWYPLPDANTFEMPTNYLGADLADLHFVQSNDVMTITHPDYPPAEVTRFVPTAGSYTFKIADISFGSALDAPAGVSVAAAPASGTPIHRYAVTAITDDGLEESLAGFYATDVINDLAIAGNINTVSWSAVTGADRYNIYRDDDNIAGGSGVFNYIGQTTILTFRDANISPDLSKAIPIEVDPFISANNYPTEVSYYQQRRLFAGTITDPQRVWLTRSGTESDLAYTIPAREDDSVVFKAAAREASEIRHAVPLDDLIFLTSSSEWKVTAAGGGALTPASVSLGVPSHIGASNVRPVVVNNYIIFEANRGSHWHELAFSFDAGSYVTSDLALRTAQLFEGLETVDMGYSKTPYPIVWGTSSNGRMVGMTYIPKEGVRAFHEHETRTLSGASSFKHMCVVPEGDYDYIYAVVERYIDGATVKYIERFEPHVFDTDEDPYFVDCGATYDTPFNITGITNANPAVATTDSAHGFSNGDQIDLRDIVSAINIYPANATLLSSLNKNRYKAANVTATTFEIQTNEVTPVDVDTSTWTAYISGGTVRKAITSITSGLAHLEGETVAVLGNGAVGVAQTVVGGAITMDFPASIIHIGLPIQSEIELLPWASMADAAYGQGITKNVDKIWMRVYRSGGISAGPTLDKTTEYKQRENEPYGQASALLTGMLKPVIIDPSWNAEGSVVLKQYHPLPLTLLGIVLGVTLGE